MTPLRHPGSYLVVELTNRCSLACVHCAVSEAGHGHHQRTGYLDPALFSGLVADLARVGGGFDTLILFWLGEPLLHPHFTAIYREGLRAAARHGTFGKIEVHTNATHLTEKRVAALLNAAAVPQVLHLSLDADSVATYKAVKGMDRFDRVVANIHGLLDAKAKTRAVHPRVVFQYIVGSNNVDEVGPFRARWEAALRSRGLPFRAAAGHVPPGDDTILFFRQLDCPTAAEQEAQNAVFRRAMAAQGLSLPPAAAKGEAVEARNLAPCSGFWKSPRPELAGRADELHPRQPARKQARKPARRELLSAVVGGPAAGAPLGGGEGRLRRALALPDLLHPAQPQPH